MASLLEWVDLRATGTKVTVLVGLLCVIASAGISYYFFVEGSAHAEVSYEMDIFHLVYKKGVDLSPLTVLDSTGHAIDSDVYVANVTFWNSGQSDLPQDAVRQPFKFYLKDGKILDIRTLQTTFQNEDQIAIDRLSGALTWKHLDPGEGIEFRVIFLGKPTSDLTIVGHALNVNVVNRDQIYTEHRILQWNVEHYFLFPLVVIANFIIMYGTLVRSYQNEQTKNSIYRLAISAVLAAFIVISFTHWFVGLSNYPRTPFETKFAR